MRQGQRPDFTVGVELFARPLADRDRVQVMAQVDGGKQTRRERRGPMSV